MHAVPSLCLPLLRAGGPGALPPLARGEAVRQAEDGAAVVHRQDPARRGPSPAVDVYGDGRRATVDPRNEEKARSVRISGAAPAFPSAPPAPMTNASHRDACILAIDDEPALLGVMGRRLAAAGYTCFHPLSDPARAAEVFARVEPDLVVLDLHMGRMSGLDVMDALRPAIVERAVFLPILVVSGDLTVEARRQALSRGARDFVAKPYDVDELLLRIGNLLEMHYLHHEVRAQNRSLEQKVRARTRELDRAHLEVLERLARAGEFRDGETGQHTRRVGELAARLARALGRPDEEVEMLRVTAPLHDIGKIGIPDAVLLKPGRLTPAERARMETHTARGAAILAQGGSPVVRMAERIARAHHERWDGGGYPARLAGEAIPLEARIVAVADVVDALSSDRPYRAALPPAAVRAHVAGEAGRHFDPEVVRAFLALGEE